MENDGKEVFTIIDTWEEIGSHECWVAHFSSAEEARKCFVDTVLHYEPDSDVEAIEDQFEACLATGDSLDYEGDPEEGSLFVRSEAVLEKYNIDDMPWLKTTERAAAESNDSKGET